jgi:autotransporter-associated beta strand protein
MAQAASDAWTGVTDATWATPTNWLGSSVPGTGDTATFNAASSNTTIDLGAGVTLGTLLFDTSSAAAYTIGSGAVGSQTLTLGTLAGGVQMNSTVVASQLINANLALSTTGTYTVGLTNNSTTNTLTVAGGISASTAGAKILTVTGSGNTAISGAITNGTGTVGITKSGSGTLTLSGANNYSGTTTVNNGTLVLSGSLTSGGNLVVTGVGAAANFTSGTYNITTTAPGFVAQSYITDGGSVTVGGSATLNIGNSGNSWFAIGDTAGSLNTTTVTVNSGGTINAPLIWGLTVGRQSRGVLTINTGGLVNVNSSQNNQGIIIGDSDGNNAQAESIVNLNGGTLATTIVRNTFTSTVGTNQLNFNGGTLKATATNQGANFFANLVGLQTNVRDGGGTIDNSSTNITVGEALEHSHIGGDAATDGGMTFIGSGTTTLSGANTYTGATTINNGTLKLANTGSLASTTYNVGAGAIFDVSAQAGYSLSGKAITLSLNNTIAGSINATGLALDLGGTLTLNLTTGAPAAVYTLFTASSTTGNFDSINLSGSFSGALVNNSGTWTGTSNGYSFTLDQSTGTLSVAAVPEPNVVALIAVGLFGALAFVRRRSPRIADGKF